MLYFRMESCSWRKQRPVNKGWQEQKSIYDTNRYMLVNEVATDVCFDVGPPGDTTLISAHKFMLISRSEVFEAMFCSGMSESINNCGPIIVPDIDADIFYLMLLYIYTDDVDLKATNAAPLLYAARKYMLASLVPQCENILSKSVKVDNVCTLLEQSCTLVLPNLQSRCLDFIAQNMSSVVKTDGFLHLSRDCLDGVMKQDWLELSDELDVYNACIEWAKSQLEDDNPTDLQIREVLSNVIYRIRFLRMDLTEFAKLAGLRNILSLKERNDIYYYIATGSRAPYTLFDGNPRQFVSNTVAATRFSDLSQMSEFDPKSRTVAIDFMTSFDTNLTAVGLYGGKYESEHDIKLKVYNKNTLLRLSPTSVKSDGSQTPIKVALSSSVAISARVRYTISVRMIGPVTYSGCGGSKKVSLSGRRSVWFYTCDSERLFDSDKTNVLQGQIPVLYFWTQPTA